MKKCISFTLAVLFTLCFALTEVSAKSYDVDDTDVIITVDEDEWYVFTRDNVSGNSELKNMGISAEYFYNSMINTNTYLDMFKIEENNRETIEFKIIKENTTEINNYKNLSAKKLKKIGEQLANNRDADSWKVYSNDCSYIYMEYATADHNVVEYYTIVNQEIYRLIASKANKFSDIEMELIKEIVDNAQYTINPVYANENWGIQKYWSEYGVQTIVGIILVALVVAGVIVYKKRTSIKAFFTGKSSPNDKMKKELKETRYVETAPKTQAPKKPKKPSDASMVTIDRHKRNSRKK